ncbi:MAG: pyrroline-5-carboxylate reductase [Gemmataceae bacterium]|nr:pyrroline-5-carboxylate reductase [Gemmataceae bacterium]MCS7270539.1 pyrroline-5-carboxylate reductase [Gemmataceae bacterium]
MSAESWAVGFLGAGQMATALAEAWCRTGCVDRHCSCAWDVQAAARERFCLRTGLRTVGSNQEVAAQCRMLVIAVKPSDVAAVLEEIRPVLRQDHLVVSVAAGVRLQTLRQGLGGHNRLVRVMPNTACLVGGGASALSVSTDVTPAEADTVEALFRAVGYVCRVPEELLDAVTGLSGSGPAFVALVLEALADAGVLCGLPRHLALELAAHTLIGTARLVLEGSKHPAQVKDAVASPGGTTIAGLHVLEKAGVRGALQEAVWAATRRARELAGDSPSAHRPATT